MTPQDIVEALQSGRIDPQTARARYWAMTGEDLPPPGAAPPMGIGRTDDAAFAAMRDIMPTTPWDAGRIPAADAGKSEGFKDRVAKDARFTTDIPPERRAEYEAWKAVNSPNDSGYDYDLPGAFMAGLNRDPATRHFDDQFKKPNHPTFSTYSQYAKRMPGLAGTWDGDTYVPPSVEATNPLSDIWAGAKDAMSSLAPGGEAANRADKTFGDLLSDISGWMPGGGGADSTSAPGQLDELPPPEYAPSLSPDLTAPPPTAPKAAPAPAPASPRGLASMAEPPVPMPRPDHGGLAGMMQGGVGTDTMEVPPEVQKQATEKVVADAKEAGTPEWALPMLVAGLTMMGSQKPGLFGALAEGGIAAVNSMYTAKRDKRADEKDARAETREERMAKTQEEQLRLQGENLRGDRDYRNAQLGLDERKLTVAEQAAADDRDYKNRYLGVMASKGGGAGRAPSRLEEMNQLVEAGAKAGIADPVAYAREMMRSAYGTSSSVGGGASALDIAKLQSDPDFQALPDEEKLRLLASLGVESAPDPMDAFFQQQGGGMPAMQGF